MITVSAGDIIKKPSCITKPTDITFVEDVKQHVIKSVVLPFDFYELVKDKIEDELYLYKNSKALGKKSYDQFLEIEEVVEDLK